MNQYQYQPYAPQDLQPPGSYPPPQKSNLAKLLVIVLSLLTVGGLFCCGAGATLFYVGFNYMAVEVEGLLAEIPEIQEHIGQINSTTHDMKRSFADHDDDTFVYQVEGTRGSGRVIVKHVTDSEGNEQLVSGSLILNDGRTITLTIAPAEISSFTPENER